MERWGVDYEVVALERDNDVYEPAFVENVSDIASLPSFLEWHSGIVFKNLNADWKPIYVRDDKPVMIQRSFGRGTVIIATDSYFVSNEAMLFDRQADLLAYLIGASPEVVFDEAHLGVTESPGVATLARRYRLHGVVASLAAIAVLFIWKMSMPLFPRQSAQKPDSYITGKDAGAGMINLLRRSVPPADLLETCFTEWKKGAGRSGAYSASRIQQAEDVFKLEMSTSAKQRDPVTAYRAISRILQQIK
jgi:hypothetical protein